MKIDDEIRPALKHDLIDCFEPVQVWDEGEEDVSFRLAFEIRQICFSGGEDGGESIRAVRYVDVWVESGIIGCQNHDRDIIRVDYCGPDSLDRLYSFIERSRFKMRR